MGLFEENNEWINQVPIDHPENPELDQRLKAAFEHLSRPCANENIKVALKNLIRFGLVVELPSPSTSPPTSSLAVNIAQTLLEDKPCEYKFGLKLDPSPSIEAADIPHRSRLLFWYLSQRLHINIFLFSTRSKAHKFVAEGARSSIGFIHNIDSYLGTSEFLALTTSRHQPKNSAVIYASSPMEYESEFPVAVFRDEARLRESKQKAVYTVNKQDCNEAIHRACIERLQGIVKGAVAGVIKKRKLKPGQTREMFMIQERERVYRDVKGRERLPRNTLELAVTILKHEHGLGNEFQIYDIHKIQNDGRKSLEIWIRMVELEFNNTWDSVQKEAADQQKEKKAAKTTKIRMIEEPDGPSGDHLSHENIEANQGTKQATVRSDGPNGGSSHNEDDHTGDHDEDDDTGDHDVDDDTDGDSIRTCTVSLGQILRSDLEPHSEDIIDILQDRQAAITDDI
ncbi:hypothetical protein BGX27_004919, partial [Mortierella sp. AM989]